MLRGVEARRPSSRNRVADRIGDALSERAGGRFDAEGLVKLRVPRGVAVQLAEVLDFVERQGVAAQVQPAVKKHPAVAGREDETVAVEPARLSGL